MKFCSDYPFCKIDICFYAINILLKGGRMDFNSVFSAFIGALLSFFLSIPIENQRKPKLSVLIEDFSFDDNLQGKSAKTIKLLRIKLLNRKVKPFFSWWLKREAAIHCSASVQILHYQSLLPIFKKPVHARWSRSDEPISLQLDSNNRIVSIFDPAKYNFVMTRNCYSGTEEPIDLVARYDKEDECYIWNYDIFYKGWRNNELRIPKGRYYVIVIISTSGEKTYGYFKLENSLNLLDFRLIDVSKEEIKTLKEVQHNLDE
jgi:hypothetical protein